MTNDKRPREKSYAEIAELHSMFSHVPHINKVTIYGKIDQEPQFWHSASKYREAAGNTEKGGVPFFRTIVEIPTKLKQGRSDREPYMSHLPVFCWGKQAQDAHLSFKNVGEFIHATGRLQSRKVYQYIEITPDIMEAVCETLQIHEPQYRWVAEEVLTILGFTKSPTMENGILSTKAIDGLNREISATALSHGIGEHYSNEVVLQGFVHRPPNLRPLKSRSGEDCLHFKVLVNREPASQSFEKRFKDVRTKYDIIDVVKMGPDVAEYLPKLRQGYPVYVTGRLESGVYDDNIKPTKEQHDKLLVHLPGIKPDILEEVLILLRHKAAENSKSNTFTWVTHEVFAQEIRTDFNPKPMPVTQNVSNG